MARLPFALMPLAQKRAVILAQLQQVRQGLARLDPDKRGGIGPGRDTEYRGKFAGMRWQDVPLEALDSPVVQWGQLGGITGGKVARLENGMVATIKGQMSQMSGVEWGPEFPADMVGAQPRREAFAYQMDQFLDFNVVPPTAVFRTPDGKDVSVQAWMNGAQEAGRVIQTRRGAGPAGGDVLATVPGQPLNESDAMKVSTLHYILGQGDSHGENFMIFKNGAVASHDNGLTMSKSGRLWGSHKNDALGLVRRRQIPEDLKKAVKRLTDREIKTMLETVGLPDTIGVELKKRRDYFLQDDVKWFDDLIQDTYAYHGKARGRGIDDMQRNMQDAQLAAIPVTELDGWEGSGAVAPSTSKKEKKAPVEGRRRRKKQVTSPSARRRRMRASLYRLGITPPSKQSSPWPPRS